MVRYNTKYYLVNILPILSGFIKFWLDILVQAALYQYNGYAVMVKMVF
jgi:hypothetical protein